VAMKIKKVLTLDRPFVKKSAWVGSEHIPHAFMENFHSFSQREIVLLRRATKRWTGWWKSSSQFPVLSSQESAQLPDSHSCASRISALTWLS